MGEEARVSGENPQRDGENMKNSIKVKASWGGFKPRTLVLCGNFNM